MTETRVEILAKTFDSLLPRLISGKINVNGKQIYLGTYDDPDQASAAYMNAAKEYFGSFARQQ